MKKIIACLCSLACILMLFGCAQTQEAEPFQEITIEADTLQQMIDDKETFVLIVERDNCSYCEAIDAYMEETRDAHNGIVLYRLDITDLGLAREQEGDTTLISRTDEGQVLLDLAPYFLYTPTLYKVVDGIAVEAGIGFEESTGEVALWDVESTVDFETAEGQEFWTFVSDGQA